MTARELFDAIGQVEDGLVLEADAAPVRAVRPPVLVLLRRWAPLAACVCVFAGAVLVWRGDFGRMGSMDSTMSGAAMDQAAPEAAMSGGTDATADAGAGNDMRDSVRDSEGATEEAKAKDDAAAPAADGLCLLAPSLPETLTAALTAGDGDGSYALMAYAPDELYFADPIGGDVPDTLPVYRSVMADHAVHEGDMHSALGQVLAGLGADSGLAGKAQLVSGTPKAEEWQGILEDGGSALRGEHEYWGGAATLTLEDQPALTAAGVERIVVYNDLTASVFFAENDGAELDLVTDAADAEQQAAAVYQANKRLLQYLGVNTAAIEGGDRDIYGEQSGVFSAFYAAGKDGHAYPAAVESLLDLSYRRVLVASNTDGSLSTLHWDAAGPGTLLGEYPVIGRDEALALLARGDCYGSYDERVGCRQAAENVVYSRLTYTSAGAAYHVPVWEFMVEAGPAVSDDAAALGLKDYVFFYVPAIDLDTLAELVENG